MIVLSSICLISQEEFISHFTLVREHLQVVPEIRIGPLTVNQSLLGEVYAQISGRQRVSVLILRQHLPFGLAWLNPWCPVLASLG